MALLLFKSVCSRHECTSIFRIAHCATTRDMLKRLCYFLCDLVSNWMGWMVYDEKEYKEEEGLLALMNVNRLLDKMNACFIEAL